MHGSTVHACLPSFRHLTTLLPRPSHGAIAPLKPYRPGVLTTQHHRAHTLTEVAEQGESLLAQVCIPINLTLPALHNVQLSPDPTFTPLPTPPDSFKRGMGRGELEPSSPTATQRSIHRTCRRNHQSAHTQCGHSGVVTLVYVGEIGATNWSHKLETQIAATTD